VCDSDVDYDCDRLVSCDGCGISAHQSCYGVHDLPGPDDMWLCRCVSVAVVRALCVLVCV
jgi:NuA3 HAT complex component NTO1